MAVKDIVPQDQRDEGPPEDRRAEAEEQRVRQPGGAEQQARCDDGRPRPGTGTGPPRCRDRSGIDGVRDAREPGVKKNGVEEGHWGELTH